MSEAAGCGERSRSDSQERVCPLGSLHFLHLTQKRHMSFLWGLGTAQKVAGLQLSSGTPPKVTVLQAGAALGAVAGLRVELESSLCQRTAQQGRSSAGSSRNPQLCPRRDVSQRVAPARQMARLCEEAAAIQERRPASSPRAAQEDPSLPAHSVIPCPNPLRLCRVGGGEGLLNMSPSPLLSC